MIYAVLLCSLVVIIGSIFLNLRRCRQKSEFSLIPNCLLTRYPIVFISGKPSLFYFGNYWNQLPKFLYEHGYMVETLPLTKPESRLIQTLEEKLIDHTKVHIITDNSVAHELQKILENHLKLQSMITIIHPQGRPHSTALPFKAVPIATNNKTPFVWKILISAHNWLCKTTVLPEIVHFFPGKKNKELSYNYLKFANSLAENDY